jgi:hypothetical protein
LKEFEQDPAKRAKEAWEHDKEYSAAEIKKFKGPDDPRYLEHLKKSYIVGLRDSKKDLEKIMQAKP